MQVARAKNQKSEWILPFGVDILCIHSLFNINKRLFHSYVPNFNKILFAMLLIRKN